MTDLTARELRWLHDELGAAIPDEDLQARYDELESIRDVALAVLRDQRSKLLASPLAVSVSGVASINNAENVKAIERRINALVQLDDNPTDDPGQGAADNAPDTLNVVTLTRTRRR